MKSLIFTLFFTATFYCGFSQTIVISEIMYNNPGADDYEYVELYNNGSTAVNLQGWQFTKGIAYTFPAINLSPGGFLLVAKDSFKMDSLFNVTARQWVINSALNNTGETILLVNASGGFVDSVAYSSASPWPSAANGFGASLVLCDYSSNNNLPGNWAAAITPTGVSLGNPAVPVSANPGSGSACPGGPVIAFLPIQNGFEITALENAGTVNAAIVLANGNANATQITVSAAASSTATAGADHLFTMPVVLNFAAGALLDTQFVSLEIVNDGDLENMETVVLELSGGTNGATVAPGTGQFAINIIDNDAPLTNALVITGVFDTQPAGAGVKGVELKAVQDIPNLGIFGLGSANNGGGSGGVETAFPAISIDSGECVYVVDDSLAFIAFFGFSPTVSGDAANINGDDAIELFENAVPIDVFGEINVDGTGQPWEYLDGWAYRLSGTGPDGTVFLLANWKFSGIDAFDNVPNNASAPTPFPTCAYSPVASDHAVANDDNAITAFNTSVTINVLGNDDLPLPLVSIIVSLPDNGTAIVNGLTDITYFPNPGFCGSDVFTYQICDAVGCDEATVNVTVECQATYPPRNIGVVTTVDANGHPDSLGATVQLQGVVHGIDFQGGNSIQFSLIDPTGGISLFSANNFGYTVTEGDELIVRGEITEFNCLTQITPDTLWVVSTGNQLVTPETTTFLSEDLESELLRINNLTMVDPGQWLGNGASFNVDVTNGSDTYLLRIDNDSELSSMPAPSGAFHAIGLGGQFNNQGNCLVGYQFFPRYAADIILLNATEEDYLAQKIQFYPNPASDWLFVKTDLKIEAVTLLNLLGQALSRQENPGAEIDLSHLAAGVYLVRFEAEGASWTGKLIKKW